LLAGAILMLLTATAHTIGQFGPTPPSLEAVESAMRAAHLDMGAGMVPSMHDIVMVLSFTMSVTFYALGGLTLLLSRSADVTPRLRRQVALVNVTWIAVFVVLCAYYRILPPLICGVIMWPVFLVAWIRSRQSR
jgi:hypothetical protein